MNTMHFLHHRSETAVAGAERHTSGFHDPHAVTRKALERWENEGGRIPEMGLSKDSHGFAPTRHI